MRCNVNLQISGLRFNCDAVVAVSGAMIPLALNGETVPLNTVLLRVNNWKKNRSPRYRRCGRSG
ncbi:hypothetical protein [Pseudomonas sp. ZS1P83]